MTSVPEQKEELSYQAVAGAGAVVWATVGAETDPAPVPLVARRLRLEDGTDVRQLLADGTDRATGYGRLDNEILAGLRLARLAGSGAYPPQVSRLIGYEATSAEPFALLEPYRGETLGTVARRLLPGDQHRFQVSLLTGLCWLAAAGIAHRGIGPSTVRWDGQHVQITDFSLATVIGARREAIGAPPWAAPEQRPGQGRGQVGAHDDVWAAGRLIHYVLTGEELTDRRQLADWPGLETLLAGVFGPPEERPSARELLTRRLRESNPVPQGIGADPLLEEGRAQFYHQRARKHPGIASAGQTGEQTGPAPASGPQADASGPKPGQGDQAPSAARRLRLLIGGLATALAVIGLAAWLIR